MQSGGSEEQAVGAQASTEGEQQILEEEIDENYEPTDQGNESGVSLARTSLAASLACCCWHPPPCPAMM
jgi:hypothetical protein